MCGCVWVYVCMRVQMRRSKLEGVISLLGDQIQVVWLGGTHRHPPSHLNGPSFNFFRTLQFTEDRRLQIPTQVTRVSSQGHLIRSLNNAHSFRLNGYCNRGVLLLEPTPGLLALWAVAGARHFPFHQVP